MSQIRVTNNAVADSLIRQIQNTYAQQVKFQKQVTTGQRVSLPEDDPAVVERVMKMQSDKRQLIHFRRNHGQAEAIAKVSFSGLDSLHRLVSRAQEISSSAGELNDSTDLQIYAKEINQLLEQALDLGNTKFRGEYLFGGDQTDAAPFSATRDAGGDITSVSYVGSASSSGYYVAKGTLLASHLDPAYAAQFSGLMNEIAAVRDGLESGDFASLGAAKQGLLQAEDDLLLAMSEISSKLLRLDVVKVQDDKRFADLEALVSADTDVDFAEVLVELNQARTAYQAAIQGGVLLFNRSILDYI